MWLSRKLLPWLDVTLMHCERASITLHHSHGRGNMIMP